LFLIYDIQFVVADCAPFMTANSPPDNVADPNQNVRDWIRIYRINEKKRERTSVEGMEKRASATERAKLAAVRTSVGGMTKLTTESTYVAGWQSWRLRVHMSAV
jgi:hypothetical protein